MTQVYAHTPRDGSNEWQTLEDHLKNVANLTAAFAERFTEPEIGEYLGVLHDLGKADALFQVYLKQCHQAKLKNLPIPRSYGRDHKTEGAARAFQESFALLSIPLFGHHGGMPDMVKVRSYVESHTLKISAFQSLIKPPKAPNHIPNRPELWELYLRMLYSCLVDADSLDTEQFWNADRSMLRGEHENIYSLWERFQVNQNELLSGSRSSRVNDIRAAVYRDCINAAELPQGVFRLTAPTGSGKTRSGLAFALKHAAKYNLDRVIIAIPYTSIIDQNVQVYKDILGASNVLEHHSAIEIKSDEYSEEQLKQELAAENWDAPIIATTTVQLFESLFSNRRSKCRKLHRIANSVIILDEVQTLPTQVVKPILSVLSELVQRYNVTLVLSTATQPAFEGESPYLTTDLGECAEIITDPNEHFNALKRVNYRIEKESWSWEDVSCEILRHEQVLCILNSRKDAVKLFKTLNDPNALHLSTLMCQKHRKEVLRTINERLKSGDPCRVISTQIVEAGVDIDFPNVMRALAPLDRIVQAAGRCNREGRMSSPGEVVIFDVKDGRAPRGPYATAMKEAQMFMNQDQDLHSPEIFERYFKSLWQNCNLDAYGIEEARKSMSFEAVAEKFKMIDDSTVSVVVRYKDDELNELLSSIRQKGSVSRKEWRALQGYMASIYRYEMTKWRNAGNITEIVPNLYVWEGGYNDKYGISDEIMDPLDHIV